MRQAHAFLTNDFKELLTHGNLQCAEMVIAQGDSEGGPDNSHHGTDQWLFVIAGRGDAIVNGKHHKISKGSLIVIERGETHEIRNVGSTPLKTLTFYSPPAYTKDGNELPAAKP